MHSIHSSLPSHSQVTAFCRARGSRPRRRTRPSAGEGPQSATCGLQAPGVARQGLSGSAAAALARPCRFSAVRWKAVFCARLQLQSGDITTAPFLLVAQWLVTLIWTENLLAV